MEAFPFILFYCYLLVTIGTFFLGACQLIQFHEEFPFGFGELNSTHATRFPADAPKPCLLKVIVYIVLAERGKIVSKSFQKLSYFE